MKPIRLIGMDMDGTLLNENRQISPETMQALHAAADRGVKLAICSGRAPNDSSYFASDGGLNDCAIIAINGACSLMAPHQPPYSVHMLTPEAAGQVGELLLAAKVTFGAFQPEHVLVVQNEDKVQKLNWGTYVDRGKPDAYRYGEEAFRAHMGEGLCKFVYIDYPGSPRIAELRTELVKIPGLSITSSWADNLEIMPEGVGKGPALQELAERLAIPAEQVMAIGDFDNDLDMLAYAGLSVAMGNASERVRKVAREHTASNRENGVAKAIQRFVLN